MVIGNIHKKCYFSLSTPSGTHTNCDWFPAMSGIEIEECSLTGSFHARMAELADALDSGSSGRKVVQVQVLLRALVMGTFGVTIIAH